MHLEVVLSTLYAHKLKAKFSKCHFWREEVCFLGHTVLESRLVGDPSKVAPVKDWHVLRNATEVRCFLSLAGYYRKFVKDFTTISILLTHLSKKN